MIFISISKIKTIRVKMAGRAAELVYYGPEGGLSIGVGAVSNSAQTCKGDLPTATSCALLIVRYCGMDSEIGQISLDRLTHPNSTSPLGLTLDCKVDLVPPAQYWVGKSPLDAVDRSCFRRNLCDLVTSSFRGAVEIPRVGFASACAGARGRCPALATPRTM